MMACFFFFFFFQAEDGIRDVAVTGVQTCALPIFEHATYDGNLYGTPIAPLDDVRASGHDIVLKIDVQGAEQVRKRAPDALRIFLAPPSMDELLRRRTQRHSESARDQASRQRIAEDEMALATHFDHVVVNDDLERAVREILEIIDRARER